MLARLVAAATAIALLPSLSNAASFFSDFNSGLPAGTVLNGSASVDSGLLKITSATQLGVANSFYLPNFTGGAGVTNLHIGFNLALGGGTCCGVRNADGFSINYAPDVTQGAVPGEEGTGTGLTVTFDTWDNNGDDTAPAIDVRIGGVVIAFQSLGTLAGALREGGRPPAGPVLSNSLGQEVQIFPF